MAVLQQGPVYDKLLAMWYSQRKPGQLILGDATFEVLTPNGEEAPVFNGTSNADRYTSISYSAGAFQPDQTTQANQSNQPTPPVGRGRGKAK